MMSVTSGPGITMLSQNMLQSTCDKYVAWQRSYQPVILMVYEI